jgi:hypothetical protein
MGESFFQRWARRKAERQDGDNKPEEAGQVAVTRSAEMRTAASADLPADGASSLPTLDDVMQLTRESDYSPFVSPGIDKTVRRAALKKLFSDPHFNVMDRLDIYIDDYNKPSPLTPAMLAGLKHTQSLFEAVAKKEAERAEAQLTETVAGQSMLPQDDAVEAPSHDAQQNGVNHEAAYVAGLEAVPKEAGEDAGNAHAARGNS